MATGDPMGKCPFCGQLYYYVYGHSCSRYGNLSLHIGELTYQQVSEFQDKDDVFVSQKEKIELLEQEIEKLEERLKSVGESRKRLVCLVRTRSNRDWITSRGVQWVLNNMRKYTASRKIAIVQRYTETHKFYDIDDAIAWVGNYEGIVVDESNEKTIARITERFIP